MSTNPSISPGFDTPLDESDMHADPIVQFSRWYEPALTSGIMEPTAMTLATATPAGAPAARVVLLKGVDRDGFIFFTNYESRKGRELAVNPRAALALWWPPLFRQVRIEGTIERVSAAESDEYHRSRERGKQLAAWISSQSQITTREELQRSFAELEVRYRGREIPRPPFWGGYRLRPTMVEFWQGRVNRLHDRLRYRLDDGSRWVLERLAP